jgi:hypothetical protein
MGQSACEFVELISDPEMRVAIVPLTESELERCIEAAAKVMMGVEENRLSLEYRERVQTREIVFRSIRQEADLAQQGFSSASEMTDVLDAADINHIWDNYLEMVDRSSPAIDGIPPEEFENLKVVLQTLDWSALSGKQWYAAKRFLSALSQTLLLGKLHGSGLAQPSMTTSESETPVLNAERSNDIDIANLVESA